MSSWSFLSFTSSSQLSLDLFSSESGSFGNYAPVRASTYYRVDLYKIRPNGTLPQGLLMGTIFLMLAILALNYSLTMVIAPQYSHYGNQRYCNHTVGDFGEVRDCSKHPEYIFACTASPYADEVCTPAVVSVFIDRITFAFPFFGEVAFWGQFAFLGVWLISGIAGVLKRPKLGETDVASDEEDETTGLLEH